MSAPKLLALLALASPAVAQGVTFTGGGLATGRAAQPRPPAVPDVTPNGEVSLAAETSCNSASAQPWSATYSPDGQDLFVPLFGGFQGSGGCRVLRLDAATGAVLARIPVDESPEEVVLEVDAQGQVTRGFVSCSSGSSVAVFDGADQPIATIPLPPKPNGSFTTAFPFGLALDPARGVLWVGTNDSSGRLLAIDLGSLSLDPARCLDLGLDRSMARIAMHRGELVIPTFRFTPGFGGSTTEVLLLNPDQPSAVRTVFLATADGVGQYPSAQDLAITPDGRALVAGYDMGRFVFPIDLASGSLLAPYPTYTSQPLGKYQGLGLSPDGLLVVVDQFTGELSRLNAYDGSHLGVTPASALVGFHQAPNEAVFSPDGTELIYVGLASDSLARLSVQ